MKNALKEWSSIIDTLGKGEVIAIYRKGGLEDQTSSTPSNEIFNVTSNKFVLFPTYNHQALEKIKKEYWTSLNQNAKLSKDNQIPIKYWAEATELIEIDNSEQLLSISSELATTEEHMLTTFNQSPAHKGILIFLRVYELSNPVLITNSPDYSGCKSWIELKIDIPKIRSKSVLSYKNFNQKVRAIKTNLDRVARLTGKEIVNKELITN